MDKNEKQKVKTASHQFLKKTLQFIIPVSLLSFLITYTSVITSQLFEYYYYNFHFSTLLFPLLNQAPERKYVFLICNGIVALLAKNLSFSSSDLSDELAEANEGGVKTAVSELEAMGSQGKNVACMEEEEEEEDCSALITGTEDEEDDDEELEEIRSLIPPTSAEDEEEEERDCSALITGTEDEDDGDEELEESGYSIPSTSAEDEVNMNTEELNRKFDEFIRKMKEEIRIEAQQQLITV